jgi:hypothetical protein
MVSMGVAESLRVNEDVISKFANESVILHHLTREDVFASFQPRLMHF